MRAYSTVQQLLCHGGYCELILSLARTSCRLLFTARPTARSLAALRGMSEPGVAPTVAVDHLKPRTDLATVIIVVAASTASNVNSVAFAASCSEVGAGGETGSGKDGGDCVMDTSDSGAGGSASGITHIRDTGNCGYSGGVGGASVSPAAVQS